MNSEDDIKGLVSLKFLRSWVVCFTLRCVGCLIYSVLRWLSASLCFAFVVCLFLFTVVSTSFCLHWLSASFRVGIGCLLHFVSRFLSASFSLHWLPAFLCFALAVCITLFCVGCLLHSVCIDRPLHCVCIGCLLHSFLRCFVRFTLFRVFCPLHSACRVVCSTLFCVVLSASLCFAFVVRFILVALVVSSTLFALFCLLYSVSRFLSAPLCFALILRFNMFALVVRFILFALVVCSTLFLRCFVCFTLFRVFCPLHSVLHWLSASFCFSLVSRFTLFCVSCRPCSFPDNHY